MADEWWGHQKGLRQTLRTEVAVGGDDQLDRWAITIRFEDENFGTVTGSPKWGATTPCPAALPRPSQHPAHGALYGAIAEPVQGFLAPMSVLIHEQGATLGLSEDRHESRICRIGANGQRHGRESIEGRSRSDRL